MKNSVFRVQKCSRMATAPKIDEKWFWRLHFSATRPIFIRFWSSGQVLLDAFCYRKWSEVKRGIVHRASRGDLRGSEVSRDCPKQDFEIFWDACGLVFAWFCIRIGMDFGHICPVLCLLGHFWAGFRMVLYRHFTVWQHRGATPFLFRHFWNTYSRSDHFSTNDKISWSIYSVQ